MDELFKTKAGRESLPILEERALIERAQAGNGDSTWKLLVQYRGLLQKVAWQVRKSTNNRLTVEQIEDLEADLVLAAVETIQTFDLERYTRLSQVLASKLKEVAMEMTTALTVPRGTLALWFKIWHAAEQDFSIAEGMAPGMGMAADTFRAISHALAHAGSDWVAVPFSALTPTPDAETYKLAQYALSILSPAEREVIELGYGFRGDPKTDQEVADIVLAPRVTVSKRRERAIIKMRTALDPKSSEIR